MMPRTTNKPCRTKDCEGNAWGRGLCYRCYAQEREAAEPGFIERKRAANRRWAANRVPGPVAPEKRCGQCKQTNPADAFYRQKRAKDGLQAVCKACQLIARHEAGVPIQARCRRVGITVEQYERAFAARGGRCVTCERPSTDIDHCHATGKVRGLLCARCNRILGTVGDDADHLRRLIAYLKDPPGIP